MHLGRVIADDAHTRAFLDEPSFGKGVLSKGWCSDDNDGVERGQCGAQAGAVGREVTGEERVVVRKAGSGAERLLENGTAEMLRERYERRPRGRIVHAGAGDDRQPLGGGHELSEL